MNVHVRCFLIILVILGSTACYHPLRKGTRALNAGNFTNAEEHAKKGLREEPLDPYLNALMADSLVAQKKYQEADAFASKVYDQLDIKGDHQTPADLEGRVCRTYGKVKWELGDTINAVTAWRRARSVDETLVPTDQYIRAVETAIAFAESKFDFEASVQLRTELAALVPDHANATADQIKLAREALADSYERDSSYEDAISVLELLESDFPEESKYPFGIGRLNAMLSDRDDAAIAAFDRSIEKTQKAERIAQIERVASRAQSLGSFSVAIHYFDRAIAEIPKASTKRADIHLRLAALVLSTGAKDQGRTHLLRYLDDVQEVNGKPVRAAAFLKASDIATTARFPEISKEILERGQTEATISWRLTKKLAEYYVRRGKKQDVERILNSYIDRKKGSDAYLEVGRWASSRRDFDLARHYFEKAVATGKVYPSVWRELARVYAALGYDSEVRTAMETYIKKSKKSYSVFLEVATIYRAQRMYEDAEAALKKAMKMRDSDFSVARTLESLYREWGRREKIKKMYSEWVDARGNKPEDVYMIGERFWRQGDWDLAEPYLKRAAKAGRTRAWLHLSDIYKQQRKTRAMKDALDQYLAGSSNRARALVDVYERYRTSQWPREGEPILRELVQLEPSNVVHYENLSKLLFDQGRDVEAFDVWKKFVANSKNQISALENMSMRFARQHKHEWVLSILHQVLENEKNPDPKIYKLIGDAYAARRKRQPPIQQRDNERHLIFSRRNRAKEYYNRYLQAAKPNTNELRQFADSMQSQGFWNLAADAYEQLEVGKSKSTKHLVYNYGRALLNLGRSEEAGKMFAKFYETRKESVDAARAISDELFRFRRFRAAEPYLVRMMESSDEALTRRAFMSLVQVYQATDRTNKIGPLVADYLARTQNPTEARRTLLQVLESNGQWEEATNQIERLVENQDDQLGYQLAINLYRQGRVDDAREAFRNYAEDNANPSEAWLLAAAFYADRGMFEDAEEAYSNATNSGANDVGNRIKIEYAAFKIRSGDIDGGRALFEEARKAEPTGQREVIYVREMIALQSVGYYEQARETARAAIPTAYINKPQFFRALGFELANSDPAKVQRMLDDIKAAGFGANETVSQLVEHGFNESAVEKIEEEIQSGDLTTAVLLVSQYAEVFVQVGGVERLMRAAQPLLDRDKKNVNFARVLGQFMMREGEYQKATLLLRRAVDRGSIEAMADVQFAYLKLGRFDEAAKFLQMELISRPLPSTLERFVYWSELVGEHEKVEKLIQQLTTDERFARSALPVHLRYRLQNGDVSEVISDIRSIWLNAAGEDPTLIETDRLNDEQSQLVATGLIELAKAGYVSEAAELSDEIPPLLKDQGLLRDVALRIYAFANLPEAKDALRRAATEFGSSKSDAVRKLRVAQLAVASSHLKVARDIAMPLLKSTDLAVSTEALRVMLQLHVVEESDPANVESILQKYMASHEDKATARAEASATLVALGLDSFALQVREIESTSTPTETNLRKALEVAHLSENGDATKYVDDIWHVSPNPRNDFDFMSRTTRYEANPKLMNALLSRVETVMPNDVSMVQRQVQWAYRQGDVTSARERIREFLDDRNNDQEAMLMIIHLLNDLSLDGEIAGWLVDASKADDLSPEILRLAGLANIEIGRKDIGIRLLDTSAAGSLDPNRMMARIARSLVLREQFEVAARFAELAIKERPGRLEAYLWRGAARVALGDTAGAKADIDKAFNAGVGRQRYLYEICRIALTAGEIDFAEPYVKELMLTDTSTPTNDNLESTARAINVFVDAGRAKEGVKFIEKHAPELTEGKGIASDVLARFLSQLYESAGDHERAFAFYDDWIRSVQFGSWNTIATPMNNLAYQFSTTNKRVDEGMELVNLAIAFSRDRNDMYKRSSAFIDTRGWLKYRMGDLEGAEKDIRNALRSTDNTTEAGLHELLEHLAIILEARGKYEEAINLRIRIRAVEKKYPSLRAN